MSILLCFPGTGKTYLDTHYRNVIDLESFRFRYDDSNVPEELSAEEVKFDSRRIEIENWVEKYVDAIVDADKKYDFVLTVANKEIQEELTKRNIEYSLVLPEPEYWNVYKDRFIQRGNTKLYIERMQENWCKWIEEQNKNAKCPVYTLKGSWTLRQLFEVNGWRLKRK